MQYLLDSQRDGTPSSQMLSLLQEQGKSNIFKYAQCAFCGRNPLPVAQASREPHQLASAILTESQYLYSHIPSLDSTVVSLTRKSEFSIWGASVPMSTNSPSASTWSPTNTSSFLLKPSKQPVFAPTSISFSTLLLLSSTPAGPNTFELQISSQNCR